MLTRLIHRHYVLDTPGLLNFDNLHKLNSKIPIVMVTHNRWVPYFRKQRAQQECHSYYQSKVLVLIRNPLDTCVSQYFQWKHRSKAENILLKGWPSRSSNLRLTGFLDHPDTGVRRLCEELNIWYRESVKFDAVLFVRYEDLRQEPNKGLRQIVDFMGIPASEAELDDAIEYGSFANMKGREARKTPASDSAGDGDGDGDGDGADEKPGDEMYKARSGQVGGYSKYLTPLECEFYENMVAQQLLAGFGYSQLPKTLEFSSDHEGCGG